MKRFYCKKCEKEGYMTRGILRKHLRKEHLVKRDLRCFTDNRNRRHLQPWWGEEEWE